VKDLEEVNERKQDSEWRLFQVGKCDYWTCHHLLTINTTTLLEPARISMVKSILQVGELDDVALHGPRSD
jgi:hypothetical protein